MAKLEQIEPDGIVHQSAQPPPAAAVPQQGQTQIQSCYPGDVSICQGVGENIAVGNPWTTGLFDCQEHPRSAIMSTFLPCVTFGQIVEVLDAGEMSKSDVILNMPLGMYWALGGYIYLVMMPGLCSHWLMGSKYRAKLRRNYNLVEAPHTDVITHIFCPFCALSQEFRELKNRGHDPALGWKGIMAQQQAPNNGHLDISIPPQNQSMTR
ncbi:protein PLANT CADMIUM RESISTANCE 8-like isoform X1 [Punica granatum]|uniref:Protein PLANT CADMIUM RESISTANCE 8-like isoform X1 n=1 Tax=Punica granatum TaxID=22663 RepID=A0A6P8CSA0_PUNGR|nr:protein PLANT CADMIUM RESISTANCE 8-like isoform X1 [Punica granatum]